MDGGDLVSSGAPIWAEGRQCGEAGAVGAMTAEQVQEDAFRQVRALLAALGMAK